MQSVKAKKFERTSPPQVQLTLLPITYEDLQLIRGQNQVSVFCRGFCFCTYEMKDRFARNYCLAQLHESGKVKLKDLSRLFGLSYQHCSNVVVRYKEEGIEGIIEKTARRYRNRAKIDEKIGKMILELRAEKCRYREIGQQIRFRYRKRIEEQSLRAWVLQQKKAERSPSLEQLPLENVAKATQEREESEGPWKWNGYAGSLILYSVLEWSGWFRPFETYGLEAKKKRDSRWGAKRVLLTLFFLHALRCKSIEQMKHLVGKDFAEIVGGEFLQLQGLRYAVDEVVKGKGFEKAMDAYYKDWIVRLERRDRVYYTDGHFSTYYGKQKVPKGWDPRRQTGFPGRNTIYMHDSQGSILYLFESAANTSLNHDIETMIEELQRLGTKLKRKTLIFDRGGYAQSCFRYLNKKKMYFVTYLKNRKKEREIPLEQFESYTVETEEGEEVTYKLFEKEKRLTKYGKVRVIVLLGKHGRQIPIITNQPYFKKETIIYFMQRRWREENCFKYMIEHFGIDLLTTYKVDEGPDHVVVRNNPQRQEINRLIHQKKNEQRRLQSELGQRLTEKGKSSAQTIQAFLEEEKTLRWDLSQLDIELFTLKQRRETIPSKTKINLRDECVIHAQKRRMLMNAIKSMNYNAEKWLQEQLKPLHAKKDETLSMLRNLWRQPGQIQHQGRVLRVKLTPLDQKPMRESLDRLLKQLKENNQLRLPDGRSLEICQAH